MSVILAAKCAVNEKILADIERAGITAVELYMNFRHLHGINEAGKICKKFPFRYAIHAPNDGEGTELLAELAGFIKAEIIVFHNIYWEDEWMAIVDIFKDLSAQLCLENTHSVLEPFKFNRRFKMAMCLDMEHVQIECGGIFEDALIPFMKMASHVHLTGYYYGSNLWHTHIHHSPKHSAYLLDLLRDAGYSGFVVSEAKTSLQTLSEFKKLNRFMQKWQT